MRRYLLLLTFVLFACHAQAQLFDFGMPCSQYNTVQLTRAMVDGIGIDKTIEYLANSPKLMLSLQLDTAGVAVTVRRVKNGDELSQEDLDSLIKQLESQSYYFKSCYYLESFDNPDSARARLMEDSILLPNFRPN